MGKRANYRLNPRVKCLALANSVVVFDRLSSCTHVIDNEAAELLLPYIKGASTQLSLPLTFDSAQEYLLTQLQHLNILEFVADA